MKSDRRQVSDVLIDPNMRELDPIKRTPLLCDIQDVYLPPDFIITPFDDVVLGLSSERGSGVNPLSSIEIAARMTEGYRYMLEKVYGPHIGRKGNEKLIIISKNDINNYFERLSSRNDQNEDFPEIRDRYNLLFSLYTLKKEGRLNSEPILPPYKTEVQYLVAQLISHGYTHEEINRLTKFNAVSAINAMIKLDLQEVCLEESIAAVNKGIEEYECGGERTVDRRFKEEIVGGNILAKVPKTYSHELSSLINRRISALWIKKYNENPEIFANENMGYIQEIIKTYLCGKYLRKLEGHAKNWSGTTTMGTVNKFVEEQIFKGRPEFGGFIVRLATGQRIDYVTVPEIIDNLYAIYQPIWANENPDWEKNIEIQRIIFPYVRVLQCSCGEQFCAGSKESQDDADKTASWELAHHRQKCTGVTETN